MARNLKKGSKVYVKYNNRLIPGTVVKKFTAAKGSVNVDTNKQRTLVHVRAAGNTFSKRPSELRRR